MLIDTHCHINMMIKKKFDTPLSTKDFVFIKSIVNEAKINQVTQIINVGTSLVESKNSIAIAQQCPGLFATVGIHPNDCTATWQKDFAIITTLVKNKEINNIVGIGECGIDRHYPNYNLPRQCDAFKAHIELALTHDLALVIHSRNAYDETLHILEEYKNNIQRGVMHCFSYDRSCADTVIKWNLTLGIGATLTYPKNEELRALVSTVKLQDFILETDAPFLPPQIIRGKQNHPKQIKTIATFVAELRNQSFEVIAQQTTKNARYIFNLDPINNAYDKT